MEKEFFIEVVIRFDNYISAENESEAIEKLKDTFMEEYNIDLQSHEITKIVEQKTE